MLHMKSDLEYLTEEFGTGDATPPSSAGYGTFEEEFDDDYGGDPVLKAYQNDLLRQDPYMQQLREIEVERQRFPVQMVDLDLIGE
ncbi:MAG: hypothetical protein DI537_05385 [Stutzerimonas stutzeri]|nr:MAG: hypothetical protein DI537_05385 [Stutzerimonas stutzeri]